MASHPVFDYEDRGQRTRHRVGNTSRPADSTVACARRVKYFIELTNSIQVKNANYVMMAQSPMYNKILMYSN